jgi:3'-phosphoadenosine 5'-phosphosulfate sulfotransferase (PAPS reductase)/FAD synthetase
VERTDKPPRTPRAPWDEFDEHVLRLCAEHYYSQPQTALLLDRSTPAVAQRASALGIKFNARLVRKPFPEERAAMNHIAAISGGKDSTAMALRLAELHPDIDFRWICTPTGNEPDVWFAHMRTLADKIGPIIPIIGGSLDGMIRQWNALPNWRQRWCTRALKIEPFAAYLAQNTPARVYVGLRADEEERSGGDYHRDIPGTEMIFPLREWGWGIEDVRNYLRTKEQTIPDRTDCKLCFFQRLIEWWDLWHDDPAGYAEGEAYETLTGNTFRSPGRDAWPTKLADLRAEFERGRIPQGAQRDMLKSMQCRVCRM